MAFSDLPDRVAAVRSRIEAAVRRGGHGQRVRLVAVTKTHGPDAVEAAWKAGIEDVGENRVQEALSKQEALQDSEATRGGIRWHLIGHVQTNKAKVLPNFSLVHSLDRDGLVDAADAVGVRTGSPVRALVQLNVAGEGTKGGYAPRDVAPLAERLRSCRGVVVCGVMTMAPLEAAEAELRRVFAGARDARAVFKRAGHPAEELSMGMSGDFEIALEEGATLVRLGTVLFGARS